MGNKRQIDIPLLVSDFVDDTPTKVSGRRRIPDLDALDAVPNDALIIVHHNNRDYKITKSEFFSSFRVADTSWDDLFFPASAARLDSAATRYSFDYTELGITFDADARYANEQLGHIIQIPHRWKEGSTIQPHVHWIQTSANVPNWGIEYRVYNNNEAPPAVWTTVAWDSNAFTYTSGTIAQITGFPDIDMTDKTLSCFVDLKFFRDTANATGLFGSPGTDPLVSAVLFKEFDIHIEIDSLGSNGVITKDTG